MPLLRCQNCGQAYDVPPAEAVRLVSALAACSCGEWLSGNKAALLSRILDPGQIEELDFSAYRVEPSEPAAAADPAPVESGGGPQSVRVIARGGSGSVTTVFTIDRDPLWIGRRGCHIELDDAELSIRHCSILRRGNELYVRDEESHTGTFLDGVPISEERLAEGMHLLRAGGALISVEVTAEAGTAVLPISLAAENVLEISSDVARRLREKRAAREAGPRRSVLVCIDGILKGKEFDIPAEGLVVGREGDVKLPDDYLSRRHFEVKRDAEGAIRIRDLGSRNGTFLNTLPARNTRVHAGDEIRAGVNRFRIEERTG